MARESFTETTPFNRNRAVNGQISSCRPLVDYYFLCATFQFELLFIISMTPMYGIFILFNKQYAARWAYRQFQ